MSVQIEEPVSCIACGCTEYEPCPGGCSWAAVDEENNVGLCTQCCLTPVDQLVNLMFARKGRRAA